MAGEAETAVASTSASTRKRETICVLIFFSEEAEKKERGRSATFRATAPASDERTMENSRRVVGGSCLW